MQVEKEEREWAEKWSIRLTDMAIHRLLACWSNEPHQTLSSSEFQAWSNALFGPDAWDRHVVERGEGYSGVFLDFLHPRFSDPSSQTEHDLSRKIEALRSVCLTLTLSHQVPPPAQQIVQKAHQVLSSLDADPVHASLQPPPAGDVVHVNQDLLRKKMVSVLASRQARSTFTPPRSKNSF